MQYDVIIVGAGPGGIFTAYELSRLNSEMKIAVMEAGHPLEKRRCPIDGDKVKTCIGCKSCSIMSGFGGAGAFSDGKYNITNDFGGTLYEHIGRQQRAGADALRGRNQHAATAARAPSSILPPARKFKKLCIQNKLNLLDASVRHLGTDINYVVLQNLYEELQPSRGFLL